MKKILVILSFTLIISLVAFATSNTQLGKQSQYAINLMRANKMTDAYDVIEQLPKEEQPQFLKYFEEHNTEFSPFYFIVLADMEFEQDHEKALIWYYYGKLRATQDVYMCKDTTNRQQTYVYPQMAEKTLTYYYQQGFSSGTPESDAFARKIFLKVLDMDEKAIKRVSPKWACYHGISALNNEPVTLPQSEFPRVKEEVRNSFKSSRVFKTN